MIQFKKLFLFSFVFVFFFGSLDIRSRLFSTLKEVNTIVVSAARSVDGGFFSFVFALIIVLSTSDTAKASASGRTAKIASRNDLILAYQYQQTEDKEQGVLPIRPSISKIGGYLLFCHFAGLLMVESRLAEDSQ